MATMNRRERKKEATRESIIQSAITLFKEKGYHKTSMDEIAEKVDVSKATLYNYFPDKGSILISYFQSSVTNYGKEIKTSLKREQGIRARLENLLDFKNQIFGNDVELTANYLKYRLQTIFDKDLFDNPDRSGLENVVLEIIMEAQSNGEIRDDLPPLVVARTFLLLATNYFLSSMYIEAPLERENLKDQLLRIFLDGAKPSSF
jgi:AcrR family transcriptional regulator